MKQLKQRISLIGTPGYSHHSCSQEVRCAGQGEAGIRSAMNLDVGWTPTTLYEAHRLDERLAKGPAAQGSSRLHRRGRLWRRQQIGSIAQLATQPLVTLPPHLETPSERLEQSRFM